MRSLPTDRETSNVDGSLLIQQRLIPLPNGRDFLGDKLVHLFGSPAHVIHLTETDPDKGSVSAQPVEQVVLAAARLELGRNLKAGGGKNDLLDRLRADA